MRPWIILQMAEMMFKDPSNPTQATLGFWNPAPLLLHPWGSCLIHKSVSRERQNEAFQGHTAQNKLDLWDTRQ